MQFGLGTSLADTIETHIKTYYRYILDVGAYNLKIYIEVTIALLFWNILYYNYYILHSNNP